MKKTFLYKSLVGLMLVTGSGCSKFSEFGDTNLNPSATTEPRVDALLTNALANLGGYAYSVIPGYYAQYFAQTQYPDAMNYSLQQLSFTGHYNGLLYDLQNIQSVNSSNNQNQVAKIIQQYIFSRLTDQWGDIPYSEALKGIEFNSPKYDRQEDIYKAMLTALTTAVGAFDSSPITGDIIYNGDVASWKRFANSLRLVLSMQLSKKYPGSSEYAATEFKAALADAGGVITTNAQNFKLNYSAPNYKNPVWNSYDGRKDFGMSATIGGILATLSDARSAIYGGESEVAGNNNPSTLGVPYGGSKAAQEGWAAANPTWARVLRGDKRLEASPIYILTASQVALVRAEAANLTWTTENIVSFYESGITLSHEQWGLTAPTPTYLTGSSVALGAVGAAGNLQKIATQRYIAYYPDGTSAWNVWRRTGFPALIPAVAATNGGEGIPRRYAYATSEQTTNKANYDAAVANIPGGEDVQSARVWWDQ